VHSFAQLEILESRAEQGACAIWLKLDTGMNRLGFKPKEFNAVYQRVNQCSIIRKPISLMTHLANADDRRTRQRLNKSTYLTIRLLRSPGTEAFE